jgi:hypothetical protein
MPPVQETHLKKVKKARRKTIKELMQFIDKVIIQPAIELFPLFLESFPRIQSNPSDNNFLPSLLLVNHITLYGFFGRVGEGLKAYGIRASGFHHKIGSATGKVGHIKSRTH